jgi:hypothetical protein
MVGRRAALEMGAGAGPVSREWTSGRGRALSGSVGGAAKRERKERGGVAWPRPVGGALTVSRLAATQMRRARAAHRYSDSDALALTRRAPVAERAGRCGWHVGARGPAREESAGPSR